MLEQSPHSETQAIATRFVEQIQARPELPIDPEDAYRFAMDILSYSPPADFLTRVADGLTYIDEAAFRRELIKLKQLVEKNTSSPRYFLFEDSPSSQEWMYQLLVEQGLQAKIDTSQAEGIIVDDFAYTGSQVHSLMVNNIVTSKLVHSILPNNQPINSFAIFLLGSTLPARERLENALPQVRVLTVEPSIPTIQEIVGERGLDFIRDLDYKLSGDFDTVSSDALRWCWYKVPDNLPDVFIGRRGRIHPLVRRERFIPPYRRDE